MNRYLEKIAEKIKPHHQRVLDKLEKNDGVVVDHGTGTGKTKLALLAIERAQKKDPTGRSLFIAPASLQTNVQKEVDKHGLKVDMSKVDVKSYEWATNHSDELKKNKYIMAIMDESHKMRTVGTQRHSELGALVSRADKRLLMTATPSYNDISDIAPLVNIASGGHMVLPEGKQAFHKQYVTKKVESAPLLKRIFLNAQPKEVSVLRNKKDLGKRLNAFVDSYDISSDPKEAKHFPTKSEKIINVEMSDDQSMLYSHLEGKLPWRLRLKVRMNSKLSPEETTQLRAFSTGLRQVSNSTSKYFPSYDKTTPKIVRAADSIQHGLETDKNFKAITYSNYRESGVDEISKELSKRGIAHSIYHGGLTKKEKDRVRDDYNSAKNRVMLITSSGSEGLDTKNTKLIQILEPHFNESKMAQISGRGVRYKSHEDLPERERHVEIERYHSIHKAGWLGKRSTSIDEYLYANAEHKSELGDQVKALTR